MQCRVILTLVSCTCMCMHWHNTLVCRMYWVQTQISMKNNKQTKKLLCVQMQMEGVAALHMRADGLHADADKYKERRRRKNPYMWGPKLVACGRGHRWTWRNSWWTPMSIKERKKRPASGGRERADGCVGTCGGR